MTQRPIFVVGAPRSGTSLLRATLSRHPAIEVCDETHFFFKVWIRRRAFGDLAELENRRRVISQFLSTRGIKALGLDNEALAQALMREGSDYRELFAALLREVARQRGKSRFGEKTPRHALFSNTLCDWFPNGSLIHIVRDPRDVAASLKQVPFGREDALANARIWLTHVRGAMGAGERPNYLLVKYEQFVREPETELRRIMSFVGEDFTPSMLDAQGPSGELAWWFRRAQTPVDNSRAGMWRRQLDDREKALVEWAAGAEMKAFGYEPETRTPSRIARAAAAGGAAARSFLTRAANLPTLWYYWVERTNLAGEEAAWARREPQTRSSIAERLREVWRRVQSAAAKSAAARYELAAGLAVLTFAVHAGLYPMIDPGVSYFLCYPAALVAAYALGLGPGLLTMALSSISAFVVFSPQDMRADVRLLLFLATASVMVYAAARIRARLRRLEDTRFAAPA